MRRKNWRVSICNLLHLWGPEYVYAKRRRAEYKLKKLRQVAKEVERRQMVGSKRQE